jgi:mitosis inhibitor protein kinase SWE1
VVLEAATNICVPDGGRKFGKRFPVGYTELTTFRSAAWHAIREDDFSIIDFTYLSPALVDLITLCMRGEPNDRPTMAELAQHPILKRARSSGKDALSPEDELWLPAILANAVIPVQDAFDDSNEDVEMADV